MLRLSALTLALLPLIALADGSAGNPETLTERSNAKAREVLDATVAAMGGAAAIQGVTSVRLTLEGETWPRLQMTTPQAPFQSGHSKETLLLDLSGSRLRLETANSGAGFEGHNTVVLKRGEGTNYDHRARVATAVPAAQASQQQFVQYQRRLPNLILRQALERGTSLRYLGEDVLDGAPHEVVTFVMPDTQQVAVYVDAKTRLVSKYELAFTDPLAGEEASEVLFGDYVDSGGIKVPKRWEFRQAGETASRFAARVEINPAVDDAAFEVAADGYAKAQAVASELPQRVEQLGEGIYVIQNVAGQNQNTLAIAFKDFVLAVEAPGSSAGADRVIQRIKETLPGKPIRYLAMTHHHGDHIGGLRSFIAEGATVVTTPGNRAVVETMAKAPQNDRLAKSPRAQEFLFVEKGRRVVSDGDRSVEFIDVGPHPHAREMLIAYLPKERLLFQGDLFAMPNNDAPPGPPQESSRAFARFLAERKLKVDRIASVHGRTVTIEEFVQAAAPGEKAASR
ncbi:MAG TPA: MBL fold metallo-hydrolase [Tahibacter sp.]|uniref:MBL fold metallo-hydrolase n=1 Tax=Tahibacter sp. TaxID=2056211 RepID=UPI002BFD5478|nr:MBL fold metallo-hydrolase [Tahibacter sp.]HSX59263.1 MBL fold metallo-hydrolase [Tahibacter sp.]